MLLSGEWIRAEEKNRKAFTFQNYAKLISSEIQYHNPTIPDMPILKDG